MFRAANAATRTLAATCATTSCCCHCEGPIGANDQEQTQAPNPFRVVIVGSGLTGCLTALRIRQRANSRCPRNTNARPVEIAMVERATYPAGRFGAVATYQGQRADIGAQVLSTLDPLDPRALGGHGVQVKDIQVADRLVQKLLSQGVIVRAREEALGETEERMLWEGLWKHYFATSSMASVLQKLLDWAGAKPIFGVRIDSLDTQSCAEVVHVQGISRQRAEIGTTYTYYSENYDCVVLCIPAPDVLRIHGVRHCLSENSLHVLENVGYDQRRCEAHFFSSELRKDLTKAFGDKVEIMVEDMDDKIQYISCQNRKSSERSHHGNNSAIALVAHGRVGQLHPLGHSLDRTLSQLTGKDPNKIASHRLFSKSIPWQTSQMITPMEAVISDPPSPAWQCIVGRDRRLLIAGDFMTQSSFLGSVASADAAAKVVMESL